MRFKARRAYLAGIIDADGHVSWRGGRYQAPVLGVTNTSTELLGWLTVEVGGSVATQRGMCPSPCLDETPGHRHRRAVVYRWQVTGERACIVLRAIRPFMVIKGDRADVVLRRYEEAMLTMQRPARRLHHRLKERDAMMLKGWD